MSLSDDLSKAEKKAEAAIAADEVQFNSDDKVIGASLPMCASAWGRDDWDAWLRLKGTDPESVTYTFGVTTNPNGGYWNKLLNVKEKTTVKVDLELDLPALYAASKEELPPKVKTTPALKRTTVIAFADAQIGKKASRGGTPELIERLKEKRARLATRLAEIRPESIVIAEVGDLFEGFESGGNPMFTNDLSLHQQMDMAGTEMINFIKLAMQYGHVDVMCVPSNHTQWRRGKQQLGNPGDDLGLLVHKQVQKIAIEAGWDVSWVFPDEFAEASILDVQGTKLGVVHGNQYPPGQAVKWWSGQQHGGQPIGASDILLAGHYHHFTALPTGRNPYTKKTKWFLQAPTLDNGSDWYRNWSGDDSDPGLLIFDITDEGFDLQSLDIL